MSSSVEHDGDDRAGQHGVTATVGFDDHGVVDDPGQVHDSAFHLALFFLGCLIVAVFGEIAQLAGGFDLAGDVDSSPRGEVGVLGKEPVERSLRELLCRGHLGESTVLESRCPSRRAVDFHP